MFEYREYAPPDDLADTVRCIWFLAAAPGAGAPQRILPDGCAEVVFNFADRFEELGAGTAHAQPAQLVVGPSSRHMLIRPTGAVDLAGVRFHPGGAAAFLTCRLAELSDRTAGLGETRSRLDHSLWERMATARTGPERRDALLAGLRRAHRPATVDRRVVGARRLLAAAEGRLTMDELVRATGISARTLERLFDRTVGMPPKRLARLERFQAVLRRARHGTKTSGLREAALAAGYFDQAHFLREFHAFAGVSPSTFYGCEDNEMSGAFTGGAHA